jgi:glutathione synthase/RimK-type ligase-like ATP-grasp enzyme
MIGETSRVSRVDDRVSPPRVAVMYEPGAFSPLELFEAAAGLCDLIWVIGWSGTRDSSMARLLPRLGTLIDIGDFDRDTTVAALREARAEGIAVFTDAAQEPAAELAEQLGLPFHSPQTALRLRDKLEQRRALRAGGLPVPDTVAVSRSAVATHAQAEAVEVTWPAVLKPRRGSGGSETFLVSGPDELVAVLEDVPQEREFILEEYLPDRPDSRGAPVADMISVEMVVVDGVSRHVAISGRFPIVAPLRENGGFLPSHLDADASAAVVEAAQQAVTALGVERGVLHIEVKQTPAGPRIVEVNGRVGGIVPTMLRRVGGPPIINWALRLALGLDVGTFEPIVAGPVAFYYVWLPPVGDFQVQEISGFDGVKSLPQVDQAWLNRHVGDRVNSREGGMFGHLAAAYGAAPSHEELWPLVAELAATPSFELDATDPSAPRPG